MKDRIACVRVLQKNGSYELFVEHGFYPRSVVRLKNLERYDYDIRWKGGWVLVFQEDLDWTNIPYRIEMDSPFLYLDQLYAYLHGQL